MSWRFNPFTKKLEYLVATHNDLGGIQGGTTGEYYHLSESEHTVATQAATSSLNGYATSTQISKLDGIEALADVTDATNVDAAGAVMNSDTSTSSMSFVIDEDTMASNLDTKVPTQQSVKAYADTKLAKSSNLSDVASAATAFGNIKQSATTSATGVVELATQAEVLAGTDTSRAVVPVDLHAKIAVEKNPLSMAQGIAMTAASSGSSGIMMVDNANINLLTGNFTICRKLALSDWTPSAPVTLINKRMSGVNTGCVLSLRHNSTPVGKLNLYLGTGSVLKVYQSTAATELADGAVGDIVASVTMPTALVAGSVVFYVNGQQLGTAVAIAAGTTFSDSSDTLYLSGSAATREASTNYSCSLFNRALSAAEVLSLYQNGIAEADKWGSQTALTSGTLTVGKKYRINTYVSDDDFTNVGAASNTSGVEFVATGTTPTHWAHSSSLVLLGATLSLESEGVQPAPGQWLDSSTNKLHAWQPATGSSLTRYKNTFEIRGINTWSGTHEAQSIAWPTDASKAILPVGCYIDSIIGVVTGATIEDIIIGDGSDTDRWVEATTGLAAGTVSFTIANHISDGTNYEMVVDPDANFTGSIEWTIRGTILD